MLDQSFALATQYMERLLANLQGFIDGSHSHQGIVQKATSLSALKRLAASFAEYRAAVELAGSASDGSTAKNIEQCEKCIEVLLGFVERSADVPWH